MSDLTSVLGSDEGLTSIDCPLEGDMLAIVI